MTPERKQEIKAATKDNPVYLTDEEVAELREVSESRLRMAVGAGRFVTPVKAGSKADEALKLKNKGNSNAVIAQELGLAESSVRRILETSRQRQINEATPENPVSLTRDEMLAMDLNQLKVGVANGRFTGYPTDEGRETIARIHSMKDAGYSEAEIAEHMSFDDPGDVRLLLALTS